MKILIFSDIHGKSDSALFLKQKAEELNADYIFLLGDNLYHGPRNDVPEGYNPKKVAEVLNSLSDRIIAVRGNCEAEVDQMMLSFPCLETYALFAADKKRFFLTHGHVYNKENRISSGYEIFLSGHTHLRVLEKEDGIVFVNPGSISIPKGDKVRSWALYEENQISIYSITGTLLSQMTV